MQVKEKIEFYFKVLGRFDQYIQLANTKASNHLTLLSSLLVAVTALVGWGVDIQKLGNMEPQPLMCSIIIIYIFFLLFSYCWYQSCMKVIQPNRRSSKSTLDIIDQEDLSTIFYKDIDRYTSPESYKTKVNNYTELESLNDLLNQVHVMAHVTNKKFDDYETVSKWVTWVILSALLILLITTVIKTGG
jgi:hypothetical protein